MTLYQENPNLKLLKVTTVRGDVEYRRNCKYIGQKYYRMNRDCFHIDGVWYRFDGGKIVFDHERKEWLLTKNASGLVTGVVGFDDNDIPVLGQFTPNPYNNVICRSKHTGMANAISSDLLLNNGYVEDVASTIWYPKSELGAQGVKKCKTIRNEKSFTDRGYNIEDNSKDFSMKMANYAAYQPTISKNAHLYARYLGDLTFGAEIEIARGNLANNLQNRHGVVICRDGSIDGGPELVTIPLSGAKGIQTLKNLSEDLITRGDISIACALHLHIGSIRTDKTFIAALYMLSRKIQDELFTMFPYYKTDHRGIKRKNYNQKLESLSIHPLVKTDKESYDTFLVDTYAKIFDFLAEGRITLDQFNKKTREHPIHRKWERSNRYYWNNLTNMFFGHRGTAEFRLHQATTNHHKIINWLFICSAIIKYADHFANQIITSKSGISVKEVLDIYKTLNPDDENAAFLSDYLNAYFVSRQTEFKKDFDRGDKLSEWDMADDKKYTFTYKGVTGLI